MKVRITVDAEKVDDTLTQDYSTFLELEVLSNVIEVVQASLEFEFLDTDREIAPVIPIDGGRR